MSNGTKQLFIDKFASSVSKKYTQATNAWNDANSGFRGSTYGQQYQKDLEAYQKKEAAYKASRGWTSEPKSLGARMKRQGAMQKEIGKTPNIKTYYDNWINAGSPVYREATDTKADSPTSDNFDQETSGSSSPATGSDSASLKKGYEIQGSSARGYGYSPSRSGDADSGSTTDRRSSGDGSDGLGTGSPSGERVKKQFKPLGK